MAWPVVSISFFYLQLHLRRWFNLTTILSEKCHWNRKLGFVIHLLRLEIGSPSFSAVSGLWWMPVRQHLNQCLPLWWLRTEITNLCHNIILFQHVLQHFLALLLHQWEHFLLQVVTSFTILTTNIYTTLAVLALWDLDWCSRVSLQTIPSVRNWI